MARYPTTRYLLVPLYIFSGWSILESLRPHHAEHAQQAERAQHAEPMEPAGQAEHAQRTLQGKQENHAQQAGPGPRSFMFKRGAIKSRIV